MDVGSELRQARDRRGLSLHDLSERTKIGVSALRAIENNDIERLPGGIFTRGFLKAYAFEVGLDPADATDRYLSQFEPPPEQTENVPPREPPGDEYSTTTAVSVSEYSGAISAIAAVVLVAACFFVLSRLQTVRSPDQVTAVTPAPVNPAPVTPAASPQESAAASRAEVGTAGASHVVRVELQPSGPCWVSATADGTRVIYRTLEAGERQTIDVRDALELRVGDAAACEYAINGRPGRPLGPAGKAATVTIKVSNHRDFIRQ